MPLLSDAYFLILRYIYSIFIWLNIHTLYNSHSVRFKTNDLMYNIYSLTYYGCTRYNLYSTVYILGCPTLLVLIPGLFFIDSWRFAQTPTAGQSLRAFSIQYKLFRMMALNENLILFLFRQIFTKLNIFYKLKKFSET